MKTRTRPLLISLPHAAPSLLALVAVAFAALALVPTGASAQDAWAAVSPDDENFTVRMPAAPAAVAQPQLRAGELQAEGRRYEAAGGDGATYLVLSLRDTGGAHLRLLDGDATRHIQRVSPYLDAVAELTWEALVRPEAERRRKWWRGAQASLSFVREFERQGKSAREYWLKVEKAAGPVYLYADGPRFYVVAAFGPEANAPGLNQFVESFVPDAALERRVAEAKLKADAAASGGVGPGRGGYVGDGGPEYGGLNVPAPVDYSRPFRAQEVSRRAQLKSKPEPGYTEAARKFNVQGSVRLRAILGATGAVERISVIRGLPHGLTGRAVAAARKVKFDPAEKDGRRVSQYVTIDYDFRIY